MPEAPGLTIEKRRLIDVIGGTFLGIIGNPNSYGYHLERPPPGDYSRNGPANTPIGPYACAIDVGMDWAACRSWLRWLIGEIRDDRIQGIAEVIGSTDGRTERYWSDSSGWHDAGVPYEGNDDHIGHTHVAIYRSSATSDHRILAGWTRHGHTGDDLYTDEDRKLLEGIYFIAKTIVENVRTHDADGKHTPIKTARGLAYAGGNGIKQQMDGDSATLAAVKTKLDQLALGGIDPAKVAEALRPVVGTVVAEELGKRLGNG